MKLNKHIGLWAAALLILPACQDSFDDPALQDPQATVARNISIAEAKERYWDPATNYIDTIREDLVIAGRVISSDASGNIYKNLVIQDETGALTMSINANSLYNKYRIGQQVVVSLKDMYIGKYNGLQQLGFPEWYAQGNAWEATFMPLEFFEQHAQLSGLPEPAAVDTLRINYADISSTTDAVKIKYQSQLVRFDNCHFEDGGELPFTDGSQITSNRNLILSDGNSIIVRTSGYSNFWADILPKGNGSVVGILSYYGTSGWQLILRSAKDCIGFGEDVGEDGTKEHPWSVDRAIMLAGSGASVEGWISGSIVGAVAPGVTAVASNDDIEWTANVSMPNTLVIAPDPATTDWTQCLVIELPADTPLRQYANLLNNPAHYGKTMGIYGRVAKVLSTWGITGNSGDSSQWWIDGYTVPSTPDTPPTPPTPQDPPTITGEGTQAVPYTCADVIALGDPGTTAWVSGYIVGYVAGNNMSAATFDIPADRASNILLADAPDIKDATLCVPVALASGGAARAALNLMDHPEMLGAQVKVEGSLQRYMSANGVRDVKANYEVITQ